MADFEPIEIAEVEWTQNVSTNHINKSNTNSVQVGGVEKKTISYDGTIHKDSPFFSTLSELKNAFNNNEEITINFGEDSGTYYITEFDYERVEGKGIPFSMTLTEVD